MDLKGYDYGDKVYYISNDEIKHYHFWKLQLVVKIFGNSTKWTHQSKFNKSPKVFKPTNKKTLL